MIAATRRGTLALLVATLAALGGAPAVLAETGTPVGGTVESTLALSLGEPSLFASVHAGHKHSVYDATIPVEVTATDAPVSLSLADGEAISGTRRGHLVRGHSIVAIALQAAVGRGRFRSLDASVDPVLEQWSEPVSLEGATIRLRQAVRGTHQPPIGGYHKLLLVTVTAAGP
ncbi:MAG TPA: hypothetical protein VGP18_00340 [Solirubrobacteraceae bacterium]|jgi:hypothetical protein|nr:hypothetical protein [Solirubrobacteraceae bacterium]